MNGFENIILKNWDKDFYNFFIGATIMNGIISYNRNPTDVISNKLYNKRYQELDEKEKTQCLSFGILIKEIYSSFSKIICKYNLTEQIPELEIIYETYQKCERFLSILFNQENIIFDRNNEGILKRIRRLRNAYSHLSIIYTGNAFSEGKTIGIDRNSKGEFRNIIESEELESYRKELFYIITLLSQIMTIFPFLIKKDSNQEDNSDALNKEPRIRHCLDYNSGCLYLVEKCLNCNKEITIDKEGVISAPNYEIISYSYDEILDKKFPNRISVGKSGLFCNINCFKEFIIQNTTRSISKSIITELEKSHQ